LTERGKAPSHLLLYTLMIVMTALWSINYVVAKIALREIPALLATGLRTAMAGLIMLPIYGWSRRNQPSVKRPLNDVLMLLVLGITGVALNQVFFVIGLSRTSVAHAAIVIGITPILVLIIAKGIGQETLGAGKLVGMMIALAGVVVLQLGAVKSSPTTLLGDFCVLLGALTFAIFTVMGKRVSLQFDNITLNTFAYVGGGLSLLPITLWQSYKFPLSTITLTAWSSVLYMALFSSVICYLIYYYALRWIPASRVAAFSYLQPVLATVMAIPILGEHPTASIISGGALVLAGVFITERL
jgi:drug/metabolite transporter (DMT)-like permease